MKVLLLVNASASSVTARARVVIQKALTADHDVSVAETSRRGHATRLAQGAAVVVLGGDGTLNEAANGLAGSSTALGVLPGGSTNVFARTIGVTNEPIEATGQLLTSMSTDQRRRVGHGNVNGRYFLFHVGIGFDAAVVEQVERRGALKRYAGHPLFVWAGFSTWFRHYDRSRPRFAVRADGGAIIDDGYLGICLNTSPYTYLGNRALDLVPGTGLDDPLAMVTVRTMHLTAMLTIVGSAILAPGRLRRRADVDVRTGLTALEVEGFGPVPYQVDGDFLGHAEHLFLRHEPDCLDLLVP